MGGGSHNEGVNSSDLDLLYLIPAIGIDPSGGMGIYTNTSTKKKLKDIVRHYQPFTHTFWLSLKTKLKHQLPIFFFEAWRSPAQSIA